MACRFSPNQGGNPVGFILTSEGKGSRAEQATTVDYARNEPSGIWFPKRVTFKSQIGDTVHLAMRLDIEVAELNQPIPDVTFTLAGLGLRTGTPVELPEVPKRENQPTWQDGKLDAEKTRGKQAAKAYQKLLEMKAEADNPPPAPSRWPYYLAAGAAAIIGGWFLYRAARRRGTT